MRLCSVNLNLKPSIRETRKRAAGFAGETNAKKYYSDLDKLAGDADIDAVYIASPISSHCDQALKMLNAGKHVLCEKTIASNLRELIKMKKAAEDNNGGTDGGDAAVI